VDVPETRYAKSGDVNIAYQLLGSGPFDLVEVPQFVSNVELRWEFPEAARFYKRLASFCRLICFDKRGTGMSDRAVGMPNLEERMDDVRAVMDAAGSERAALFGQSEGGPMSILFAATYPQRTRALVLFGAFARHAARDWPEAQLEARVAQLERGWGAGALLPAMAPSAASDDAFRRLFARYQRQSASPSAVAAMARMNRELDVQDLPPAIRVPTLVLHREGDPWVTVENGRYLAGHVPGAKYVELAGQDHFPWIGDSDRVVDEVEEFLTGSRSQVEPDRVLATVLFTDIVDSTRRAAELGDRQWRSLLARHDEIVRQEIVRFHGRVVKSLGDGFLATFDGPARAVRSAAAIIDRLRPLGIAVRSGLHTGEIELAGDDIAGIAVHTAARVAEMAGIGEVLVTSTVRDLVAGASLRFADRGNHALKGLPEALRLFAAAG